MKKLLQKQNSFFVAGHNGMVGKAIIKALKNKGYCNEENGGKLLKISRKELDLSHYSDVKKWFNRNRPEIVIIAAAKVGGIYANYKYPYNFISENLKIAHNLIDVSWLSGVKRLLFLGSSCIYPKNANLPISEEELLASSLENTNEAYAIAKISGIKLCEAIRKQYNFDAISLMPTNLYGPGDNYSDEESHVMASLIKKFILAKKNNLKEVTCWGTGNPLREFLHVDDLANACVHVLERWDPNDKDAPKDKNGEKLLYLNVGSGEEISIKNLAEKIALLTKYKGCIFWDKQKPDGTFRKKLDLKRIKSLNWRAEISLDNGLKEVIKEVSDKLNNEYDKGKSLKNFI